MPSTKAKPIDFDEMFEGEPDEPVHTQPIKLFGREWTLVSDLNHFALEDVGSGQPGAFGRLIDSMIAEDERAAFHAAAAAQKGMTIDKLVTILTKMLEVAGERPTEPPSASSPTARPRTSKPKSVAPTSRTRGGR